MKKFLGKTALVAALTLSATPAFAVNPNQQATANARIIKPLVLTWVQDLDLGTIVLSGAGAWTGAVVSVDQNGGFSCTDANVTCSGTTAEARYHLAGTNQQVVDITVSPSITLNNLTDGVSSLSMTVDAPATVTMPNSGALGVEFGVGGSISVDSTTPDGVYQGVFDVTADYQ
ncbi:MAG TPA: DUF4402 domain-containing protein [Sphingomicrobium sp.]|nr:DUF4402 domain-containing protein [Sphingomicrobium sp.]